MNAVTGEVIEALKQALDAEPKAGGYGQGTVHPVYADAAKDKPVLLWARDGSDEEATYEGALGAHYLILAAYAPLSAGWKLADEMMEKAVEAIRPWLREEPDAPEDGYEEEMRQYSVTVTVAIGAN